MTFLGLILGLRSAKERRRYFVTTSLIGWAQAYTPPCIPHSMFTSRLDNTGEIWTDRKRRAYLQQKPGCPGVVIFRRFWLPYEQFELIRATWNRWARQLKLMIFCFQWRLRAGISLCQFIAMNFVKQKYTTQKQCAFSESMQNTHKSGAESDRYRRHSPIMNYLWTTKLTHWNLENISHISGTF